MYEHVLQTRPPLCCLELLACVCVLKRRRFIHCFFYAWCNWKLDTELVDGFTSWIFLLSRDSRGGGSSSEQTAHTTSLCKEHKHTQLIERLEIIASVFWRCHHHTSWVSWQPEGYTKNSCWGGRGVDKENWPLLSESLAGARRGFLSCNADRDVWVP